MRHIDSSIGIASLRKRYNIVSPESCRLTKEFRIFPVGVGRSMSLKTVPPQAKYGLVKKANSKAVLKKPALFKEFSADADDDELDAVDRRDVGRVNSQLNCVSAASERAASKIYSDALSEDPTAFDYDNVYDSFKAVESKAQPLSRTKAPESRYISNLMTTAGIREKEKDRAYDRKLLKERKLEDAEFGGKAKFMTSAYKQKLVEDQKWEKDDRATDEMEASTDFRSQGMHGFYANLLTKNIAMGGDVIQSAVSSYTAGSQRQSSMTLSAAAVDNDSRADSSSSREISGSKRKYDDQSHLTESDVADDKVSEEVVVAQQDRTDPGVDTIVSSDVVQVTSKAEIISSARQRFLDRKMASES